MPMIDATNLPSGGFVKEVPKVNIKLMTYSDMKEYEEEVANTYLQKLDRDLYLLGKDIKEEQFDLMLFYDFDFLVGIKKNLSVTEKPNISSSFRCQHCEKDNDITFKPDDFSYLPLEEYAKRIKAIKIDDKELKVRLPKIRDVKKVLNTLLTYNKKEITAEVFLLCCILEDFSSTPNDIIDTIENSVKGDIVLLQKIASLLGGRYKQIEVVCKHCNKRGVIKLDDLMTDIFQLLSNNIQVDVTKIIVS